MSTVARIHTAAATLYAEQVEMPKRGNGTPGDLLSSDEVIARLLEDERLRRLALTCVLPAVRCGAEWKYRRSDLDAWIEHQDRGRTPASDST